MAKQKNAVLANGVGKVDAIAEKVLAEPEVSLDQYVEQYKIKKEYIKVKYADLTPFFAVENTALSKEEVSSLEASIKAVGIIQPIVIADGKQILEGSHRCAIALDLGWEEGNAINLIGLPEGLKAVIAYQFNFARRNANPEKKRLTYTNFEERVTGMLKGKTFDEGVKILPDIARFFEKKKDGDQTLTKTEINHAVSCFASVNSTTSRVWRSDEKARQQMHEEQPDIYPIGSNITQGEVHRWRNAKKNIKKNKGSMLYAVCGSLCKACEDQPKCGLLSAIWNRKCQVDKNIALVEKFVAALPAKEDDSRRYSHPKMILAEYYRKRKAIAVSDKVWQKTNLPHVLKEAMVLYEACQSNLDFARFCIEETAMRSEAYGLPWALTTVLGGLKTSERVWNDRYPNQSVSLKVNKIK